jgi:hypothetical protein
MHGNPEQPGYRRGYLIASLTIAIIVAVEITVIAVLA